MTENTFLFMPESNTEFKKGRNFRSDTEANKTSKIKLWSIFFKENATKLDKISI